MKVVAYIRVSTDKQADVGLGLGVQQETIRAWAKANGHKIVAVYREEGVSGTREAADRPALADAIDAIRSRREHGRETRQADGIVVPRLDRLARDLVLQEQLLAEIRRMGAELFTASAGEAAYLTDDADDPSRKLIRQILGAVAGYERDMIALRLRSGRRRKATLGGYAFGSPPYGQRSVDRALVPDVAEAATVDRIRELSAGGASLRAIASVLHDEGRPPKRGQRWHPATLARVLARPAKPTTSRESAQYRSSAVSP